MVVVTVCHKGHAASTLAFWISPSGGASHHNKRKLKQPHGQIQVKKNCLLPKATWKVDSPILGKPLDDHHLVYLPATSRDPQVRIALLSSSKVPDP